MILNSPYISGSLTVTGNIITSGSITISGSIASASYATNAELLDGLDSTAFATTGAYSATSASLYATSASLSATSGSLSATSGSLSTASGSFNTRVTALEATGSALSSSLLTVSGSGYATSASLSTDSGSFNSRVATIESKYATTGSNNFRAPQYVSDTTVPTGFSNTTGSIYTDGGIQVTKDSYFSGSMFIKGNLTIYGTQSVAYITSSQLNIATNLITVNTATPSVRFGGLAVYDSGSTGTGATGSLLWDSQNNGWVYQRESGSTYAGGMLISGPRRALGSNLGDEQGLTACMIPVAQGGDHITSSLIYHDVNSTCFYSTALIVNGSGIASVGTTPSAWSGFTALQSGNGAVWSTGANNTHFSSNTYYDGANRIYISTGTATEYASQNGAHWWGIAASGTGGTAQSMTEYMRLNTTGLGIGTTNPGYLLDVCGTGRFTCNLTVGGATAATNVQLILNGVSSKAQRILFQNSGTDQWLLGAGAASETSAFEIYNATGTIVLSINKSTNVSTFAGGGIIGNSSNNLYLSSNSAAGEISFWGNQLNTRLMTLTGCGNVGIGTASPFAIADINLSINGTASSALQLGVANTRTGQLYASATEVRLSAVTNAPIRFYTNDTRRGQIKSGGDFEVGFVDALNDAMILHWNGSSSYGSIQTYSSSNLALQPSGNNVLIGSTTDYSGILQANGTISIIKNSGYGLIHYTNNTSVNQYFLSQAVSNGFLLTVGKNGACTQPYLALGIADGEIMRIANTGCVGINVTSPKTPLEVANIHNGTSGGSVLTLSSITNAAYGQCMVMQGYFSDTGNGECAILGAISIEKWRPAGQCNGGDIAFYTRTPAGSNMNNPTERARIYNNGSIRFTMSGTNTAILEQSYSVGGNGCINVCFDIYNAIPGKGSGYVFQADIHVGGYGSAGASGLLYKASVAGYDGHYVGLGSYHKDAELVKCASGVDIKIYNPPGCQCLLGVTIYNCSGTYSHVGTMRMVITY